MNDGLKRLADRSIRKMDDFDALEHIGLLIDQSADGGYLRGAKRALYLLDELETREVKPEYGPLLHYFRANAWSAKAQITGRHQSWEWEQADTQQKILALSRAVSHEGFAKLDKIRQCQILTNRANLLNRVGRFIDAIEGWDQALRFFPRFAMARGNRGNGLKHYASALHDPGHHKLFLLHAYDAAISAGADDAVFDSIYPSEVLSGFETLAADIAEHVPLDEIRESQKFESSSLGRSKHERAYRRWCLEERLFLNPLNDLGPYAIAAHDVLTLPTLTEANPPSRRGLMPPIIGFYNQMKQEFSSARFMLFEGITGEGVHFSDRGVLLYNTLDYPSFSLAMERVRTSFRIAYSLLDKVAFLINGYWRLNKQPDRVNFRNVWMVDGKATLLPGFAAYENWPLRGLFWLSKEIFDEKLKLTTNPDARELDDLRHYLEHKYLQVHESWAMAAISRDAVTGDLGKSISSREMVFKALRVMKIARSALCYLSYAIGREERLREKARPQGLTMSMPLSKWDDAWKRSR